ncbi:MAG: hypothetical protein WA192_13385 [Candidatus Acidiferrales bacterium]
MLSGPVTASWTMSHNPIPSYVEEGTVFALNSKDLIVDGVAEDDIICFFNLSDWGGVNSVTFLPDLVGDPLHRPGGFPHHGDGRLQPD